jgi:hypothetical protein
MKTAMRFLALDTACANRMPIWRRTCLAKRRRIRAKRPSVVRNLPLPRAPGLVPRAVEEASPTAAGA